MLEQIPLELRKLHQWVSAGENKLPINPRTGAPASVTDSTTWGTFEDAIQAGLKHVGFVLTKDDPYAAIDLDDPEKMRGKGGQEAVDRAAAINAAIIKDVPGYTEISQSGNGAHIFVKGSIPSGVRRDTVEVYSESRYMICTGNAIKNNPIEDQQEALTYLYEKMVPTASADLHEIEATMEDAEIFEMASNAANADKFNQLCAGDWEQDYESQSEADLALLSIIAFYTMSDEQVRRMFRMSALGKREKAIRNDKYIDFALGKIRAKQPALIDFSKLNTTPVPEEPPIPASQLEPPVIPDCPAPRNMTYPPGLVGDIARYIYSSATRPVPEVALAAAIALVSGVCGRSYNISGTGLNQYIILVAKTGMGKEGAATGIDAMISAARKTVPPVDEFIGPSAFASGQALIKVLDSSPCFISILGEFGLTLQQLCDPRANANQIMMRRVLLDLYSKSGWTKTLRSSVYSDQEKNTRVVQAPNVTLLGETTPSTFYDGLDQQHVAEGLIPRFMVIEYHGMRPPSNQQAFMPPPEELTKRFVDLVTVALTTSQNLTCAPVQTDTEAKKVLDELDRLADDKINAASHDVENQIWNRAHLKALKLGAVIAVGVNPHNPVITKDIAKWAVSFSTRDAKNMVQKFADGLIGTGDHRQENDVHIAIRQYLQMDQKTRMSYKVPKKIVGEEKIIPYTFLRRKLRMLASFKNDRRGSNLAIKMCLEDMESAGVIQKVAPQQVRSQFGLSGVLYISGESFW